MFLKVERSLEEGCGFQREGIWKGHGLIWLKLIRSLATLAADRLLTRLASIKIGIIQQGWVYIPDSSF